MESLPGIVGFNCCPMIIQKRMCWPTVLSFMSFLLDLHLNIVLSTVDSGHHEQAFSVDWLLNIDENVLDTKLGFSRCTFAKMLMYLAEAICDQHDDQIPFNYDDLLHLPGIDDRAAMLYLNYSADRSGVSFLLVICKVFPSGS